MSIKGKFKMVGILTQKFSSGSLLIWDEQSSRKYMYRPCIEDSSKDLNMGTRVFFDIENGNAVNVRPISNDDPSVQYDDFSEAKHN